MDNSNTTVGYALGIVEGYLEGRIGMNDDGASVVLEYFKAIEQAYKDKVTECFQHESKLQAVQNSLK
jgi:hypothetical protein